MVYTLALDSSSWLAALTGESAVTIYTSGSLLEITRTALAGNNASGFNGFFFKINGALVLIADAQPECGRAIGPD